MHFNRTIGLGVCFAVLVASARASADDGFVIVVNASAGAEHALTRKDVKALFLGEKKVWGSGAVVQLTMIDDDDPALTAMASAVFGVPSNVLRAKIKQRVFAGDLRKPNTATSEADLLELVKKTPGAIAVVSAANATHLPSGVTSITIGG
jgi:ABC-type phosphate transport system substrate-binding protein